MRPGADAHERIERHSAGEGLVGELRTSLNVGAADCRLDSEAFATTHTPDTAGRDSQVVDARDGLRKTYGYDLAGSVATVLEDGVRDLPGRTPTAARPRSGASCSRTSGRISLCQSSGRSPRPG